MTLVKKGLSKKDLESIICIVCSKRYGEHTKGNSPKFSIRTHDMYVPSTGYTG